MNAGLKSTPTLRNLHWFLYQLAPFCILTEGNMLPEFYSSPWQSKHLESFQSLTISLACVSTEEEAGHKRHTSSWVTFPPSHSLSLQPGCPQSGLPWGLPILPKIRKERVIGNGWRDKEMARETRFSPEILRWRQAAHLFPTLLSCSCWTEVLWAQNQQPWFPCQSTCKV